MGVTAFPHPANNPGHPQGQAAIVSRQASSPDWAGIAVCGAFLSGALLLLSGRKRAGLVVTTAATAVTLLDQQETILEWWNAVPQYLENADRFLSQAQHTLDDLAAAGQKVRTIFHR